MPTAFLTGGTGFVGGHVLRVLVEHGWDVRLLARNPARVPGLAESDAVEVLPGELFSDASILDDAVRGADAIIHVAGKVKARSLEEYREVNLRGTERLLAAASRAAPSALFLLVSSQAAAGPSRGGRPVTEGDPPHPISWYGLSKREGEQAVERLWKSDWIVLRPAVVYGPGDRGLFVYFKMAAAGWVPVPSGSTRVQVIGAEQVALAIVRAASRRDLAGRTGFLCDPDPVSVKALASAIAALSPRRVRLLPIPDAVVRLLGFGETLLEALTGRSRPFNADKAKEILAGDWLCDGDPMRKALDLPRPPPLNEGLHAAWDWYCRSGWLPGVNL